MLNTKQQKKSNNNIRYSLGNNPPPNQHISGKPIKKNRPVKDKLQKYLSQLPIGLLNDSKQNASLANVMLARPQSSLVASDISGSLSKSRQKVDLNSFCKDKIKLKKISSKRNTLGIGQANNIKMRRQSGTSHSHNKWNNRSLQQDPSLIKMMMAENRKKYNLSCGDMIQIKSKGKEVVQKGGKKKSLLATSKHTTKTQSKKVIKKQSQNNKKFKPLGVAAKSKGSTAIININQTTAKPKKKQKQNKQNKKKHQRSKSKSKSKNKSKGKKLNKMFVFAKDDSDDERSKCEQQYPINKYVSMKKKPKNGLNIKVGLDYNFSCINIASGSSGIFNENENSNSLSVQQTKMSKKRPTIYDYQASDSINVEEIKYYEQNSPLKQKSSQKFRRGKRLRTQIIHELQQQYPYLNSTQLNFLSSVVLIQRKWRQFQLHKQLDKRRQIVTEYVVDQLQISKQNKKDLRISSDYSRLGEKVQMMSRTKVAQFQLEQQTIVKSKHEEVDPLDYETRKNSRKNQIIIYSGRTDENQRSKQSQDQQLTDRKPRTQHGNITINYAWILSKQIFPQITYLEYRRNVLRQQFQKTMTILTEQKLNRMISQKQFEHKKKYATIRYQKDLSCLKKTKHDIKKGYLKYIDCINRVKQIKNHHDSSSKTNNKYGLRKVSSQSNFLSTLYEKIFRFDKCMSEWSGGSQSIEMLTKKILIRKQYYKGQKKSERRSLSDLRSAARSSFQMLRSYRQPESNTVVIFQHSDKLANLHSSDQASKNEDRQEHQTHYVKQFKFSTQIFKLKEQHQNFNKAEQEVQQKQQIQEDQPKISIHRPQKPNINTMSNSISLIPASESVLIKVQELVLIELAKQLQRDIHSINPILMDMILINQPSLSEFEGVEYEQFDQQQSSPALQSLHRQFQTMGSPRIISVRRHYHFQTQPQRIVIYLTQLALFIKQQNWQNDIIYNMNNNQTFQPIAYLKFLRDFQIPEDQYVPIISNQRFIEWETFYNTKLQLEQQSSGSSSLDRQLIKQSQTIFHRCVFEVFLGQLQRNRPYGERGRPFPWEQKYSYMTTREIIANQLPQVLRKSINKIEQYLIYRCGLISQKIFIANEEELERAHEENEDRIIQMLQQDLVQTNHQWYQVQEHALEIKLQITFLLEEELIDEFLKQMDFFGL